MNGSEQSETEQIEKVRQEIMRFRELLTIMRAKLEDGERAYEQLFANCSPEDRQRLKEKDLQWLVASQIVGDLSGLSRSVGIARFNARELERAFEELHDIIVTVEEP
jgi:hypothetical protein